MGKHAYLIMAHNQAELLKKLVQCLDHERTDIFIHIDKKAKIDVEEIRNISKKSQLSFPPLTPFPFVVRQAKYGLNYCS